MPDDATVAILLQIKEQGQAVFLEASAGLERVRSAINKLRDAQAAGLPLEDATKRALGDLMDQGLLTGATFDELKSQITDARQALTHYSEAIVAGLPEDAAEAAVLADLALQYQEVADNAGEAAGAQDTEATASAASASTALGAAGGMGMVALTTLGVVAALLILLPPLYLVIGALAVLSSFAVAGAGMLALLGGIGLAIGGLGAGTLLLGDATGKMDVLGSAGTKVNVLAADFQKLAATLGQQALPMAREIVNWFQQGIPVIEKLGSGILTWFGDRLPGILNQISAMLRALTPDFLAFGQFLGAMFDRNESKIAPMAEDFIRLGMSISEGLLTDLEQLSNWFIDRLPTYGPIVNSIMGEGGIMDRAVTGLVTAFGKFSDYVVKQWPGWVATITAAWNTKDAADLRAQLPKDIDSLRTSFETMMQEAPVWIPQLLAVATAIAAIATSVGQIVAAMDRLEGWLQAHPTLAWMFGAGGLITPTAAQISAAAAAQGQQNVGGRARGGQAAQKRTLSINLTVAPNSTTRLITQV